MRKPEETQDVHIHLHINSGGVSIDRSDEIISLLRKLIRQEKTDMAAIDDQIAALAAAEADEHQAIGDALVRVNDKLTALASENPTLAAQIDAIKADTATVVGLAAAAPPLP